MEREIMIPSPTYEKNTFTLVISNVSHLCEIILKVQEYFKT
jgi:hypothetical protein